MGTSYAIARDGPDGLLGCNSACSLHTGTGPALGSLGMRAWQSVPEADETGGTDNERRQCGGLPSGYNVEDCPQAEWWRASVVMAIGWTGKRAVMFVKVRRLGEGRGSLRRGEGSGGGGGGGEPQAEHLGGISEAMWRSEGEGEGIRTATTSNPTIDIGDQHAPTACPNQTPDAMPTLTPVHFFSHGSTMMLGEQSDSADYWKKCGDATTIISMNARFEPHFHMKVGSALRPLRQEGYLLIGTGGAVHNLYRNRWEPMLKYSDNFAQETPPEDWALEFRQAVEDVISNNSGPKLRRGMTRLMKHPQYRDAHASDDHFMAAMFVAGAAGDQDDVGTYGRLEAETWELTNM